MLSRIWISTHIILILLLICTISGNNLNPYIFLYKQKGKGCKLLMECTVFVTMSLLQRKKKKERKAIQLTDLFDSMLGLNLKHFDVINMFFVISDAKKAC